jgi:predicted Zn-ribbon and HTH transcriptional regulator
MGAIMTALRLPKCRFCGRVWHPQEGVVAAASYCAACAEERRSIVESKFDLRKLKPADAENGYLLPKSLRKSA